MKTSTTPTPAALQVTVSAKTLLADDIVGYEFTPKSGATLPIFEAGAHIDVHLPGGFIRQYSLYDLPGETPRYRIGVLLDPNSRGGSVAFHDKVNEGDTLSISAPRNHFPLHAAPSDQSILFAGGIGITPIICMAQQLMLENRSFELHYCGRSLPRMALVDRLGQISRRDSTQAHVHVDDGPTEQQLNARAAIGLPSANRHLYVCGPTGFMDHILRTASELGWDDGNLHREYFAAGQIHDSSNECFEIEIHSTGQVVMVAAGQTVANALLEAGIEVPLSCEQGVCGTCATKVLAGIPDHKDLFLTESERARNDCFMPCCSRAKTPRLVIDL